MQFLSMVGPVALVVLGLLLLAVFGQMLHTEHVMRKRGRRYAGRMVSEVQDCFDDGETHRKVYDPVVEYRNDRGEAKRVRSPLGTGSHWPIGQAIDVYELGDRVFIDHTFEHRLLEAGLAFFGVLLIATGVCFIWC